MDMKKIVNKKATAMEILKKYHSGVGFKINLKKFNEKRNDVDFLKAAAQHVGCEIVYMEA